MLSLAAAAVPSSFRLRWPSATQSLKALALPLLPPLSAAPPPAAPPSALMAKSGSAAAEVVGAHGRRFSTA